MTIAERFQKILSWWQETRLARALARFGTANGLLLSSGMALTALTSLTAALTLAVTVFMAVLGDNAELRKAFFEAIDEAIPNLLKTDDSPDGIVAPESLIFTDALSWTGIIALAVMAWSAISMVMQLARSTRAMFGVIAVPMNMVMQYLRYAVGALALGVGLVAGAGFGIAVDLAGDWLLSLLSLDATWASRLALQALTIAVSVAIFALISAVIIQVVSGVRVPKQDLVWGCVMIAVGAIVLRMLGTTVVGSVKGPLLATAATLITLVLWLNLQVRVYLTLCAWMANPPKTWIPNSDAQVHFDETPNFITHSAPHTLEWPHNPVSGIIGPDTIHEASRKMLGED
ncbi:YhjD/YihY/BrkB family envelope integrity protein [Schaalia vaccimaxillae]|uniref:YhjD/YihY/BrkB family envelope integrity protein n=1 Tax=Schaalia vaccimaxillae TaxID=183916 RepID=UPI0003B2FCE7|nr:YhjD/YihY/BrkB family envelope integrity protein [Schaalia vaccimaxillae]